MIPNVLNAEIFKFQILAKRKKMFLTMPTGPTRF
jgi:hypothetical protein